MIILSLNSIWVISLSYFEIWTWQKNEIISIKSYFHWMNKSTYKNSLKFHHLWKGDVNMFDWEVWRKTRIQFWEKVVSILKFFIENWWFLNYLQFMNFLTWMIFTFNVLSVIVYNNSFCVPRKTLHYFSEKLV